MSINTIATAIEYALICNKITRVQVDSYDGSTVRYHEVMKNGEIIPINCATHKENFIIGSFEELKQIVLENEQKELEYKTVETTRILDILKSSGKSQLSAFETEILEMLITERMFVDMDVEEISYFFENACRRIEEYMEYNFSVYDAYMDWAH